MANEALEHELKEFLIKILNLEEMTPAEIGSDVPLFGEGLGLDSVDALELGVALQKTYGVKIDPKADDTRIHFGSIRNLAKLVASHQGV